MSVDDPAWERYELGDPAGWYVRYYDTHRAAQSWPYPTEAAAVSEAKRLDLTGCKVAGILGPAGARINWPMEQQR
jgi:hypothetical protein